MLRRAWGEGGGCDKQHGAMTATRVLIVDDHEVFADALAVCLQEQPDLDVIGTATTAMRALQILEEKECDVVALDLGLGDEDGLAVAQEMLDRWPDLGVVIVTGLEDSTHIVDAVQLGIRGWVSKTAHTDVLVTALRGVANGETHIPADLLTGVLVSLSRTGRATLTEAEGIRQLTSRELDVLACLVEGMTRNEIGELLHVSPNTVRTHVQSILHKLKVHSALSAVAIARRAGISGRSGGGTRLMA
jgi:DNA-binding NarL/FixJ family response regulator